MLLFAYGSPKYPLAKKVGVVISSFQQPPFEIRNLHVYNDVTVKKKVPKIEIAPRPFVRGTPPIQTHEP